METSFVFQVVSLECNVVAHNPTVPCGDVCICTFCCRDEELPFDSCGMARNGPGGQEQAEAKWEYIWRNQLIVLAVMQS